MIDVTPEDRKMVIELVGIPMEVNEELNELLLRRIILSWKTISTESTEKD